LNAMAIKIFGLLKLYLLPTSFPSTPSMLAL